MTREEVKQLLMTMKVTFPNFKIEDSQITFTINAWYEILKDYEPKSILQAFKTYIATSNSAFAPSVSELIALTTKAEDLAELNPSEAWAMVRKAIGRSAYNAQEEFEKLPPTVQKAVGSHEQLHEWAIDSDYNDNVVMSLFQRNFKTVAEREKEIRKLPLEERAKLASLMMNQTKPIEQNVLMISNGGRHDE